MSRLTGNGAAEKIFTVDEFHAEVQSSGDQYFVLVHAGRVVRLSRKFVHPGGNSVLRDLHGRDATEYIELAHSTEAKIHRMISLAVVGHLDDADALLQQEDKDLRKLRRKYEAEGLLDRSPREGVVRAAEPIVLVAFGYLMLWLGWWCTARLFQVLSVVRAAWFVHDLSHHAVLPSWAASERLVTLFSAIFLGTVGELASLRKHSVHHAFTNVLEHDWNNLGPFQIDRRHGNNSSSFFVRVQALVWFLALLPALSAVRLAKSARHMTAYEFAPVIVRWAILLMYDPLAVPLNLASMSLVLYIGTLNHFHTDKVGDEQERLERADSFVKAMAIPTCNVRAGGFYTWFSGGLDFHVEHHLFPTMAHGHLPRVSADVQALLRRYQLPYNTLTLADIVLENAKQLVSPRRPTMPGLWVPQNDDAKQAPAADPLVLDPCDSVSVVLGMST